VSAWVALALQAATAPGFDLARVPAPSTTGCGGTGSDEVVVCGARRDRYRLPLPAEREMIPTRTDRASGMAALTPAAPCGIFAGQRRCGRREAAAYGYGEGRDPVTLLARVAGKLADPDGE
jgi:hypothetical protein